MREVILAVLSQIQLACDFLLFLIFKDLVSSVCVIVYMDTVSVALGWKRESYLQGVELRAV